MIPVRTRSAGWLGRRLTLRFGSAPFATGSGTSRDIHRPGCGRGRLPLVSFAYAPATRRTCRRAGFTLFEVVLSLGIFLGALAAISRIVDSGSRAAVRSRLQNEAILRCESQMNQVVAGALALQAAEETPFEDDTQWAWSLVLAEGPHVDLLSVQVVVTHARSDGQIDAEFALWRLMRNPELYLEASAAAAETTEE